MEGLSSKMGRYWKRKLGYVRINNESSSRKRFNKVHLGSTGNNNNNTKTKRKIKWRFKIKPKLRILIKKLSTPKKWLLWLRDAYVDMMLGLANSRVMSGYGGAMLGDGVAAFGRTPLKEYDEKMLLEIYKSLVLAQKSNQLVDSNEVARNGIGSAPLVSTKLAAISEDY